LKVEISSFEILFLNLNFIHFWRKYCIYNFKLKKTAEHNEPNNLRKILIRTLVRISCSGYLNYNHLRAKLDPT